MTGAKGKEDPDFLSTLERGLRVLSSFDREHPEMALSEVAARTGLSPAVARRCLITLVKLRYVAQHGRRFLLRPDVLAFGQSYLASMNIEGIASRRLEQISQQTEDGASLAVLSRDDIVCLAHAPSHRTIQLIIQPGSRFAAHATALGRVLLAFQDQEEIDAWIANAKLERLTEHTVTDPALLREELARVREQGYSAVQDELDYGIVAVAVPVLDENGQAVAAIACSTSTNRIARDELVRTRLPLLRATAREIESSLRSFPSLVHSLRRER